MRKGYIKSAHIDRQNHLLHVLFYLSSDDAKGGEIKIMKLKEKLKIIFMIFFLQKDLKLFKSYKVKNNFLFIYIKRTLVISCSFKIYRQKR